MPSRHQAKKQFKPQSQITNFFSSSTSHSFGSQTKEYSDIDEQDANIQSSLLSVGMRIRKAVPEGYKTHQTHSFAGSRTDSYQSYSTPSSSAPAYSRPRELVPLCGIHSVGGLGIQESSMDRLSGYGAVKDTVNAYAVNGYFSSQESNTSQQPIDSPMEFSGGPVGGLSNSGIGNKRGYSDDEDEGESLWGPRFATISRVQGRYIAKPRSRRKAEQLAMSSMPVIDIDFEEASFLEPPTGREVEMDDS